MGPGRKLIDLLFWLGEARFWTGETFFWLPGLPGAGSWVPKAQEPRRAALVAISPYRNAPRDLKLRGEVL